MNRKYAKILGMIGIIICSWIADCEKTYAMELSQEEIERKELCYPKITEYELNFILRMMGVKEWKAPPYAFDERNLPVDETLGKYSKEILAQYLEDNTEVEAEIEYYFGAHNISKPEDKFPIQVVKITKGGELNWLGYTMWDWGGLRLWIQGTTKSGQKKMNR